MTNYLNCNKIDKRTCVCGNFHLLSAAKPPGWGLGLRLTTPPSKKILLRNFKRRPRPTQGCRADDDDDDDDVCR
jgi:hypothetical protein